MIKINLLAKKSGPKLPSFDIIIAIGIFLIVCAGVGAGYYIGSEKFEHYNDEINATLKSKTAEQEKRKKVVNEKEAERKKLTKVNNEINRLKKLSGANLVQWSKTLEEVQAIVPKNKVWITNLRIDSDRRVQITGYSCVKNDKNKNTPNAAAQGKLTEGVQIFIQKIQNNPHFQDPFLTGATQNVYEKQPVWRFELNCRLLKELASKSED